LSCVTGLSGAPCTCGPFRSRRFLNPLICCTIRDGSTGWPQVSSTKYKDDEKIQHDFQCDRGSADRLFFSLQNGRILFSGARKEHCREMENREGDPQRRRYCPAGGWSVRNRSPRKRFWICPEFQLLAFCCQQERDLVVRRPSLSFCHFISPRRRAG